MIRAVLVVKGKEPCVVEVKDDLDSYLNLIKENLSDSEREKCEGYGLDFFSVNVDYVSGMVEEYSACHPYDRNRSWHGPALFTEFDMNGKTVSMSDKKIDELMKLFSLSNKPKSKSDKINRFVENNTPEPRVFNVSYGIHQGVLNTHDYIDVILKEDRDVAIMQIESILESITRMAHMRGIEASSIFDSYLEDIGRHIFEEQAKSFDAVIGC